MQLVKVRYIHGDGESVSDREYTYFSEVDLKVGDKLTVPVRDTSMNAVVSNVDVDEAEIAAFRDEVKVIPAGAWVNPPDEEQTTLKTGAEIADKMPVIDDPVITEALRNREIESGEIHSDEQKELPSELRPQWSGQEVPTPGEYNDFLMDEAKEIGSEIAMIRVKPQQDPAVVVLSEQAERLRDIALVRKIVCDADLTPATEDLSVIAQVKKGLAAVKAEYVKPIKGHLDDVNAAFNMILKPLEEADSVTRGMILQYRRGVEERAKQASELNRQAEELARKQAEFSGTGEFTVDTTPKEAPVVVNKVHTEVGSAGVMKVVKWELVDKSLVPEDYKVLDAAKITKLVKGGGTIPGIRVYTKDTLRVNTR